MTREFFGCSIYPMGRNSWGGKWEAYCGGQFIAADSLAGIKAMIRDKISEGARP